MHSAFNIANSIGAAIGERSSPRVPPRARAYARINLASAGIALVGLAIAVLTGTLAARTRRRAAEAPLPVGVG
ncbi:hypothetical protein GCM10025868_10100 [Angustibacter aerolatus]|uniref:MFS transporter n=1 Tax=Angustibacter aerolatus TaxID=1162965 RepID=A0ABQ6JF00_9ACTN|nr:hypothetical protein GCM10025868_10100 [Angustibacter aerolatus]